MEEKEEEKQEEKISCPICNKNYNASQIQLFNSHVNLCIKSKIEIKSCILYPPSFDYDLNQLIFNNIIQYESNEPNNFIDQSIDDKIKELKNCLKSKRVGGIPQRFELKRNDLLNDILKKTQNIDLFKDWKIHFTGEEGVDAGGVLRDFFSNIFEILEGDQLKLFIPGESSDFSYILNPFLMQSEDNFKYCRLVGLLMAKAIIQNITINICFNKLMYKMILCETISFDDLIFIDSQLYNSLKNLKENLEYYGIEDNGENNMIKELGLDYSVEMKDCNNHVHSLELIKNGRNITVENLDDFIQKRISIMLGIYEPFIKEIRQSFFKFIPIEKIKCLNSNELELLINGRPFIEIEEWKSNTDYRGLYNKDHQVIKWFWEILSELSQKELSNLLLFATGSTRVPLGGFAELNNNGESKRFTIVYVVYNTNIRNFIKAHTCFNTIDVPCYRNKNELKEAIKFVSENQIWGFDIQ